MPELQFLPVDFDRSAAPEALSNAGARVLANADANSLAGRIRRAPGYARAGFDGETATITNAVPLRRRDGIWPVVYCTEDGDVNIVVPDIGIDGGGLVCLWVDVDDFVPGAIPDPDLRKQDLKWRENFEEELEQTGDPAAPYGYS